LVRRRLVILLLAACLLVLPSVLAQANTARAADAAEKTVTVETVEQVLQLLKNMHLSSPSEDELAKAALKGMTDYLNDPYTHYYTDGEMNRINNLLLGTPADPGFKVVTKDGEVIVSEVFYGSPAEKAGVKPGDRVVSAEGKSVSGEDAYPALNQSMEGKQEGDAIRFETERDGKQSEVKLVLSPYKAPLVSAVTLKNVGYIQLAMFTPEAGPEFIQALEKMNKEDVHSVIVDIRNNPGGIITVMQQIAGAFLGKETVLYGKDSGGHESPFRGTQERIWDPEKNVYLLVNEYSASASDMLAAALKDYGAAILVGKTTYGKGISQNYMPIVGGQGMLSVTTTEYLSPEKKTFHKIGVKPDVEAEGPAVPLIAALRLAGAEKLELSFHDYGWFLNGIRLHEHLETDGSSKESLYLPARTLAALCGGTLSWNGEAGAVEITVGERTLSFGAAEGFIRKNGVGLMPVRKFIEAIGGMEYEASEDTITIITL
jgi:carboxyl-terminal processing protease